jgi:hypothetical protein
VALKYILDGDPQLWTYSERYYGTLFETPFALLERLDAFSSSQQLYFFRHLATWIVFIGGVFCFWRLCAQRFSTWWLALLGPAMLIVSPRIFAESFYNSKDIPCLAGFIVAIFTLTRFLEKPTALRAAHSRADARVFFPRRALASQNRHPGKPAHMADHTLSRPFGSTHGSILAVSLATSVGALSGGIQ